jgi:hypothetical protein
VSMCSSGSQIYSITSSASATTLGGIPAALVPMPVNRSLAKTRALRPRALRTPLACGARMPDPETHHLSPARRPTQCAFPAHLTASMLS